MPAVFGAGDLARAEKTEVDRNVGEPIRSEGFFAGEQAAHEVQFLPPTLGRAVRLNDFGDKSGGRRQSRTVRPGRVAEWLDVLTSTPHAGTLCREPGRSQKS